MATAEHDHHHHADPGAMDAGLASPLFWGSLAFSLIIAGMRPIPSTGGSSGADWGTPSDTAIIRRT